MLPLHQEERKKTEEKYDNRKKNKEKRLKQRALFLLGNLSSVGDARQIFADLIDENKTFTAVSKIKNLPKTS